MVRCIQTKVIENSLGQLVDRFGPPKGGSCTGAELETQLMLVQGLFVWSFSFGAAPPVVRPRPPEQGVVPILSERHLKHRV